MSLKPNGEEWRVEVEQPASKADRRVSHNGRSVHCVVTHRAGLLKVADARPRPALNLTDASPSLKPVSDRTESHCS